MYTCILVRLFAPLLRMYHLDPFVHKSMNLTCECAWALEIKRTHLFCRSTML